MERTATGEGPANEGDERPWTLYVEVVELMTDGDPFPTGIVAHVYEERDGIAPAIRPGEKRYIGSRTYLPTEVGP